MINNDLIFDVGAHDGEDSDFYLKLGYRVIAVEANPEMAQILKKRFKIAIRQGKYVLVDKALWKDGQIKISFFVNKAVSVWGTLYPEWDQRNKQFGTDSEEIEVSTITLTELISAYGCPYYLKVDIEGADMVCIQQLETVSDRPKFVSLESTKTSWIDLKKEFNMLEKLGYTKYKVIAQKSHADAMIKTRMNKRLKYVFEPGASGLFGEYLTGRWLSKNQAITRYLPIFLLYKSLGDNTFLNKLIHRRLPSLFGPIQELVNFYDTHAMREP